MVVGSAARHVADALPAPATGGTTPGAATESTVILDEIPPVAKPQVVNALQVLTGLGTKEATELADAGGIVLRAEPGTAAEAQRALRAAGAIVHVVHVESAPARRPARRPRSTSRAPFLPPAGEQVRPSGVAYKPRDAGGHEDIALLRAARDRKEFVLLKGPPGTGKTALAEAAFAGPDGAGMETISCSADTTEADFVGTFVQDPATGTYPWVPGPLHRSVLADVPLFVDEITLADPRVLAVLYQLMDGRDVLRITANPALDPVTVGAGWFVIAACNPDAPGSNMSDALRSRFTHHIEIGSDWDLAAELGVPEEIIQIARNLDNRRREGLLTWSPQMRELLDFAALADRYGPAYAAASLASKAPEADQAEITEGLRTRYPRVTPLSLGSRYGS